MTIEEKAFIAHYKDRQLDKKDQTGDRGWSEWYAKGYRQAEKEYKQKAVDAYKISCTRHGCNNDCNACVHVREFEKKLSD